MTDARVDRSDLGREIDYAGEQQGILDTIANTLPEIEQDELRTLMADATDQVTDTHHAKVTRLIDRYGSGGAHQVAQAIYQFTNSL